MLFVLLGSLHAFAALGGDISTIQQDQARMNATVRVTQKADYTLHELRSSTGLTIREYASSGGKVFAVAWHGPWRPDLKQLLGTHFSEFQQAAQSLKPSHGPLFIERPDLVAELGGHMRDFTGRAYLPNQLPANVRPEDIR